MNNNIICVNEVKANQTSVSYGVLFLVISIIGVFLVFYPIYNGTATSDINYFMIAGALITPTFLFGGLRYFYTSTFYFDPEGKRYKHVDGYGPFKSGKWSGIENIKYVTVFRQFYADQEWENEKDISIAYDVNLWYNENNYVTMTSYTDKISALKFARRLAKGLNIGLLDSTEPNDYKWVKLQD